MHFVSPTSETSTRTLLGSGLNLEEAVGLGRDLELGVRFGFRFEDTGRGLRADEVARGFDTETFGTGLANAANPELRLRWRSAQWVWGEVGLETRAVLPIEPDNNTTGVIGAWMSVHVKHLGRVDAGLNGVTSWQSFAAERLLMPAVGLPIRLWGNLTNELFVGIITTVHYYAATPYTTSDVQWTAGLGVGYRVRACDITEVTYLPDTLGDFTRRLGIGLGLSCWI